MLSAEAYSFRQKSRLAISLSWIAGYTNIVTLLVAGHTISHMSGNTTVFSSALGAGQWLKAAIYGAILVSFLFGSAVSALMTEGARRRGMQSKYILPISAEAILLAILGLWLARYSGSKSANPGILFACVAALTMGLQNATITHISGAEVRTTHVTGVLTDLGLEGVQFLLWWRDKIRHAKNPTRLQRTARLSRRHPTFLRLLLLISILGSFGFGAIAGTIVEQHFLRLAMFAPVAFLLWIIAIHWRRPIADVRELDLLHDPDINLRGILKETLPPALVIYRISGHHADSRPPHFRAWAERIPRHRLIIILALSPFVPLTENAIFDLLAAAEQLRQQKRPLILANINQRQFQTLRAHDGIDLLGQENILPDLQLAIARGLSLFKNAE